MCCVFAFTRSPLLSFTFVGFLCVTFVFTICAKPDEILSEHMGFGLTPPREAEENPSFPPPSLGVCVPLRVFVHNTHTCSKRAGPPACPAGRGRQCRPCLSPPTAGDHKVDFDERSPRTPAAQWRTPCAPVPPGALTLAPQTHHSRSQSI